MNAAFTRCDHCGARHDWSWEEAFDKFGFDDGDGLVMTETVADVLRAHGCEVAVQPWGLHNIVITAIMRNGAPLIPEAATVGYDDPRTYLPAEIVDVLDRAFPDGAEISC